MSFDLKSLQGTLWLCEPIQLRLAIARALRAPCPAARDVATERRARLDAAKTPPLLEGSGGDFHPDELAAAPAKPLRSVKGGIGIVQVYGPIEQRLTAGLMKGGGTSVEEVSASLDALLANKAVEAIVLEVDSPGGSSYGIEELSDKIHDARSQKKIYAVANSMAASAGYWVASAAEMLAVTPGGDVGSVGVYVLHIDESKAMEAEGVKVSLVHAGKHKVEGNPFEPLSEETRAHWQESVNATYDKFVNALKRNRGVGLDQVRNHFGQGRLMKASDALAAGMVDRVMTMEQMVGRLVGGKGSDGKRASVELLRLRQEQRKRRVTV